MRQIVIDTETTGLNVRLGDRLIEIAAVELVDGRLTGNHFHRYVNPERNSEEGALHVHGLTSEFLADKPIFGEIAQDFLAFIADSELVMHNAPFDVEFLDRELAIAGLDDVSAYCPTILDTLSIARKLHPRGKNSLDALCQRYGVTDANRPLHGALLDAELLAEVYVAGFSSLRIEIPQSSSSRLNLWVPNVEAEMVAYFSRNPPLLYGISPRKFEELVAAIFRNNGFTVELTKQSRDDGVDIIAVQHSVLTGDSVNLIECKRYSPGHKVGIGVVQRLLGTVTQKRANKGIVVTTSSFTKDAIRVARDTRHVMTLSDYDVIVDWLQSNSGNNQK